MERALAGREQTLHAWRQVSLRSTALGIRRNTALFNLGQEVALNAVRLFPDCVAVQHVTPLCRSLQSLKTPHLCAQGKLGLDRGVRLENLMVSHFLSAMDRLADPALLQFVKHLQSRAQGEVSVPRI